MSVVPFLAIVIAANVYFVYRFTDAAIESHRRRKDHEALLHAHRKGFLTNEELMHGTHKMAQANEKMMFWGLMVAGDHAVIIFLTMFL